MSYQDTIIEKARDLKAKHSGEKFNENFVTGANLRKIANRFTEHKMTNVETIRGIKKLIQYMICAKLVGDRKLYTKLNEYSGELLDSFCDEIEIVDDCNDGFDTAVQRHVYRVNPDLYEYLKNNRIKYVDAGLVKYGGKDIFLPQFNALVCIVGNRRCFDEIADFIKKTPEKDRHNEEFSWEQKVVKDFYVYDGDLYCTTTQSDPIELSDTHVKEFIVDAETDPDEINIRMFDTSSHKGSIKSYRTVPIEKLENGTKLMLKKGIVYHVPDKACYKIIGHYELMKFDRYEGLNEMSIVYSYPGLKGEGFVDSINLGNLNKHMDKIKMSDWTYEYGDGELDQDLIYLFKGKTRIGQMPYRETITFENIKELLDMYLT